MRAAILPSAGAVETMFPAGLRESARFDPKAEKWIELALALDRPYGNTGVLS